MKKRSLILFGIAGLLVGILAAACSGDSPQAQMEEANPEMESGGTLNYIPWSPLRTRDPLNEESWQSDEGLVYDNLLRLDAQGAVSPSIGQTWAMQADGKTWHIDIRTDMKFHDGTDLTVDDVVFSINTVMEKRLRPYTRQIRTVTGARALDEDTVEITTKVIDSMIPQKLYYQFVTSKAYYEGLGSETEAFSQNPLGSGPYKWVSWVQGTGWEVERTAEDHAWRPANFDRIVATDIQEPATIIAGLQAGDIDLAQSRLDPEALKSLEAEGKTVVASPARLFFYHFDPERACRKEWVTCDPRVRLALTLAIDGETYSETIWQGLATPLRVPAMPGTAGDRPDLPFPYDPERAKKLLDEAGFPVKADGTRFTLDMKGWAAGPADLQSQALQADLAKVGVKAEYQLMEFGSYLQVLLNPEQHTHLMQILGSNTFSNNYANLVQWCSAAEDFPQSLYKNEEVWSLNDDFLATTDSEEQNRILGRIFEIMTWEDPCYMFANEVPETWVTQSDIKGFKPQGGAVYFYMDTVYRSK